MQKVRFVDQVCSSLRDVWRTTRVPLVIVRNLSIPERIRLL